MIFKSACLAMILAAGSSAQNAEINRMNANLSSQIEAGATARTGLVTVVFTQPRSDAAIKAKADALRDAELALATARADAFAKLQSSSIKLAPDQVAALIASGGAAGGRGGGMGFTQPEPMDFNDHEGYISLFDGTTLKGWDGNPKFWRVEDG